MGPREANLDAPINPADMLSFVQPLKSPRPLFEMQQLAAASPMAAILWAVPTVRRLLMNTLLYKLLYIIFNFF